MSSIGNDVATLALDKCLDITQQMLCLLATLNIQVEKLCRIVLDVTDLDRLLRGNDQRAALALILPQMHALDVIAVVARLDSLEQIGVVGIAGACGRHKLVGLFLVRAVLRDNDNRAIEARLLQHVFDGAESATPPSTYLCPSISTGGVTSGSDVEARTASRSSTALLTGRYAAVPKSMSVATAYISMGLASNASLSKGSKRSWTSLKMKS